MIASLHHRGPDPGIQERRLADRRIAHPLRAEPGQQVAVDQLDVLTPGDHALVSGHRLAEGVVDRLSVGLEAGDGHARGLGKALDRRRPVESRRDPEWRWARAWNNR